MSDPAGDSSSRPRLSLNDGPGQSFQLLSAGSLREYADKIRLGVERLDEQQLWWCPSAGTNSVGNLLLHLAGNLSQWVLGAIGGVEFQRDRDGEFTASGGETAAQLMTRLDDVVDRCCQLLRALPEQELSRVLLVQGYSVDVRGGVYHAVEHMSYHTGQILWIVKSLLDDPSSLEMYPEH